MGEWKNVCLHEIADVFPSNVDKVISATEIPVRLCNYMDVYYERFIRKELPFAVGSVRLAELKKFQLRRGDVIVTKDSETPNDIGMPAVVVEDIENLVCGYHLAIIRANQSENDGVFLMYALQGTEPVSYFNRMCNGLTRYGLTVGALEQQKVNMPVDVTEQRKIAEVLATVDEAIEKTRALIKKYQSIKAGMMQDLLGHGEKVPLSKLCRIISGSTPSTSDTSYWNGMNVWITPNDLSGLTTPYINTSTRKLSDSGVRKATGSLLPAKSVIISNRAPVGYCAIVAIPFTFNQGCKGLICNAETDPLYLYYYLCQSTAQLERVSSGTTFLELPKKELERFLVRIPKTKNEQEAISEQILAADERTQTERDYLAKLQDIKRGLMQDLLNPNGVSVDALL